MLVCHVALRPKGRVLSVIVTEATTATDSTAQGQIIFATIVDAPANALDVADAYLGEIMLETAAASDIVVGGLNLSVSVSEPTTATDTPNADIAQGFDAMLRGVMVNHDGTSRQVGLIGGNWVSL
jgi:hypothetical protein